ncbi:hypothetical protein [Bosea sp. PAMC 26642]|uniref:hypothetical protein n=1 Tax=Bosea sp. (strain PAMC 26642) TaxID=1792307 RepID=UPI000770241D|nr:hypothetical protein [Bosea sp. PAMC 26642]AMJ60951.1 hypothetical protein AXW83_12175 [Bosea sp. PAMC 26642]
MELEMADAVDNLEDRIAMARRNIEDLTAQATGASGAAAEESIAARLNEQQDRLNALLKQQEIQERDGAA